MRQDTRRFGFWHAMALALVIILGLRMMGIVPDWQGGTLSTATGNLVEKLDIELPWLEEEPMPIEEAQRVIDEFERKLVASWRYGPIILAATDGGVFMKIHGEFERVVQISDRKIFTEVDGVRKTHEALGGAVLVPWAEYRVIGQ